MFFRFVMVMVLLLVRFRVLWVLLLVNLNGIMFMLIRFEWWICLKDLVIIVLIFKSVVFFVV